MNYDSDTVGAAVEQALVENLTDTWAEFYQIPKERVRPTAEQLARQVNPITLSACAVGPPAIAHRGAVMPRNSCFVTACELKKGRLLFSATGSPLVDQTDCSEILEGLEKLCSDRSGVCMTALQGFRQLFIDDLEDGETEEDRKRAIWDSGILLQAAVYKQNPELRSYMGELVEIRSIPMLVVMNKKKPGKKGVQTVAQMALPAACSAPKWVLDAAITAAAD